MTEVERNWRRPPPQAPVSTNGDISNVEVLHNKSPLKRRTRSNSKSNGTKSAGVSGEEMILQQQQAEAELSRPSVAPRNKYTHIIILKSLNETFETKFLVVPFKPESFKLGRPVVNSSSANQNYGLIGNGANVGKQDPQQVPQVRPDNGHFDSRVLSRNHASLSCDPTTGKIYIRDLKSSNGTFVNGNRIDQNDVELKVGDVIDLGTDIDSKFEHRKISAFVEDISVIPLINDSTDNPEGYTLFSGNDTGQSDGIDATSAVGHTNAPNGTGYPAASATTAQRAAFEAAMFGDVNNLDLEDTVLGSETEILSGIFINNSIGTSPNLINVIKTLATEVSLEKHEYTKLKSMENFLINYTTNLEYVNKLMVEKNDKQLVKLQNALRQKLSEKQGIILQEHQAQVDNIERENNSLKASFEAKEKQNEEQLTKLERDLEDLRTRLEVEKYRNSQLTKNTVVIEQEPQRLPTPNKEATVNDTSSTTTEKRADSAHKKLGGGTLLFVSAVSIGFIAYAMTFSSEHHI